MPAGQGQQLPWAGLKAPRGQCSGLPGGWASMGLGGGNLGFLAPRNPNSYGKSIPYHSYGKIIPPIKLP